MLNHSKKYFVLLQFKIIYLFWQIILVDRIIIMIYNKYTPKGYLEVIKCPIVVPKDIKNGKKPSKKGL